MYIYYILATGLLKPTLPSFIMKTKAECGGLVADLT